ncbi:hypothetical protein HaLaN_33222 [Haematococcus lacustris]|uniref:Uncharacterized protein n=1 Tax=Haematococcus lacustris TaxID=44745 RepID=A0A6A0ANM1_HAELA|nr:hypothetical protein HaLaN_33222 [Haematococcus lacustris]
MTACKLLSRTGVLLSVYPSSRQALSSQPLSQQAPTPALQFRGCGACHSRCIKALASASQHAPPAPSVAPRLTPSELKENVEKAAVVLDEMLEQVMQELFVEQAASYLAEEAVELSECQVRDANHGP